MDDQTKALLARLRELEAKATQGPWETEWHYADGGGSCGIGPRCDSEDDDGEEQAERDARLIAETRNALPAIIRSLEELEELRERLGDAEDVVAAAREAKYSIADDEAITKAAAVMGAVMWYGEKHLGWKPEASE
jgi:hypothetical protein